MPYTPNDLIKSAKEIKELAKTNGEEISFDVAIKAAADMHQIWILERTFNVYSGNMSGGYLERISDSLAPYQGHKVVRMLEYIHAAMVERK